MEGRVSGGGGCCIARYGHNNHHDDHGFYNLYDGSKIENIMLRFRPIAPKPSVGEPNNKPTSPTHDGTRRGKRKNSTKRRKKSRLPSDNDNNKNKSKSSSSSSDGCKLTLPLLPETPDLSPRKDYSNVGQTKSEPMWLCFGPSDEEEDQTAVGVVGSSSVTVEGVTDTWMDGNSLGRTNEEKKRRLDEDTCPGFISDGWNRVCWTNKAYRRMVAGEGDTWPVMVKLGMREKAELPAVKLYPGFTCRVRVVYGTHQTMTVPCDAWGMDGGGFAWRLDVKAALSLGR